MTRRLQIPGEREEAALAAACQLALDRSSRPPRPNPSDAPDSYAAAGMALLGFYDSTLLEALWPLQNSDGGFPLWPGGPSHVEPSAAIWAAMRLAGVDSPRLKPLAQAVKELGGVGSLSALTRVEWALIGIIPADRAPRDPLAAGVLQGMSRAGDPRSVPIEEIGGPGQPAQQTSGRKSWWNRILGANRPRKDPEHSLTTLEGLVRGGSVLQPRSRAAWLALDYAGRRLDPPSSDAPAGHASPFTGGIEATLALQDPEGAWRSGEGTIHGTWQALASLRAAGYDDREAPVLRAGEWLRSAQNADGGWGESPHGEPAPSTVSHTAWALMGLIAGGDPASESVTKGVEYLLAAQSPEGFWRDPAWTQVIEPGLVYARNPERTRADAASAIQDFLRTTVRDRGTNL